MRHRLHPGRLLSSMGKNDARVNTHHTVKTKSEGHGTTEGGVTLFKRLSVENGRNPTQTNLIKETSWLMSAWPDPGLVQSLLEFLFFHSPLIFISLCVLDWFFVCKEALFKWQCWEVVRGGWLEDDSWIVEREREKVTCLIPVWKIHRNDAPWNNNKHYEWPEIVIV